MKNLFFALLSLALIAVFAWQVTANRTATTQDKGYILERDAEIAQPAPGQTLRRADDVDEIVDQFGDVLASLGQGIPGFLRPFAPLLAALTGELLVSGSLAATVGETSSTVPPTLLLEAPPKDIANVPEPASPPASEGGLSKNSRIRRASSAVSTPFPSTS